MGCLAYLEDRLLAQTSQNLRITLFFRRGFELCVVGRLVHRSQFHDAHFRDSQPWYSTRKGTSGKDVGGVRRNDIKVSATAAWREEWSSLNYNKDTSFCTRKREFDDRKPTRKIRQPRAAVFGNQEQPKKVRPAIAWQQQPATLGEAAKASLAC